MLWSEPAVGPACSPAPDTVGGDTRDGSRSSTDTFLRAGRRFPGYGVAVTNDSTYGPHGRSQHMPALPLRHLAGDHPVAPLVTVSNPAAVVEAVKLAEDGSGDLVVRLYESPGAGHGHRRRAGWIGIRDGSPGAASARGYRQRRSVYRPRAEAVPAGHVALPPLRASSYPSVVGVAGRHAPTGPNPTPRC